MYSPVYWIVLKTYHFGLFCPFPCSAGLTWIVPPSDCNWVASTKDFLQVSRRRGEKEDNFFCWDRCQEKMILHMCWQARLSEVWESPNSRCWLHSKTWVYSMSSRRAPCCVRRHICEAHCLQKSPPNSCNHLLYKACINGKMKTKGSGE